MSILIKDLNVLNCFFVCWHVRRHMRPVNCSFLYCCITGQREHIQRKVLNTLYTRAVLSDPKISLLDMCVRAHLCSVYVRKKRRCVSNVSVQRLKAKRPTSTNMVMQEEISELMLLLRKRQKSPCARVMWHYIDICNLISFHITALQKVPPFEFLLNAEFLFIWY